MEPTITCPECGAHIELSQAMAEPLVAAERKIWEGKLASADKVASEAKSALALGRQQLALAESSVETTVTERLASMRVQVEANARKSAQADARAEIDAREEILKETKGQLAEARKATTAAEVATLAALKKAASVDVEVARQVSKELDTIRKDAQEEANEQNRLLVQDLRKQLEDTKKGLDEAKRTAEQGSQQAQGEVLETDLLDVLSRAFPADEFEEVKTGTRGGDIIQHVGGALGPEAGSILWEAKRAQSWGGDWVDKAKQDARGCGAALAVIVSDVLPKGVSQFGEYHGAWVTQRQLATHLAAALRQGVLETAKARIATSGRTTKAEAVYDYLTGTEFRDRIMGIAEPFNRMRQDLISERNATVKRWNRRDKQITRVLESAMGMMGDLQGLAGKDIDALGNLGELPDPSAEEPDGAE